MSTRSKFEILPPPIPGNQKKFGKNFTYQDVVDTYNIYNGYIDALNLIMQYTNNTARKNQAVPKHFKKFDYDYFFKALQLKTTAPEAIKNYEKYFTKLTYNISVMNYYFLINSLTAFQKLCQEYTSLAKHPNLSPDVMDNLNKVKHFINNTMKYFGINNIMNYSYNDLMALNTRLQQEGKFLNIRHLAYYIEILKSAQKCIEHDRLYAKNFTRRKNAQKWSDIESDKEIELAQENFDLAKRISELERENATLKSENQKLICEASTSTIRKLINKIKAKIR